MRRNQHRQARLWQHHAQVVKGHVKLPSWSERHSEDVHRVTACGGVRRGQSGVWRSVAGLLEGGVPPNRGVFSHAPLGSSCSSRWNVASQAVAAAVPVSEFRRPLTRALGLQGHCVRN